MGLNKSRHAFFAALTAMLLLMTLYASSEVAASSATSRGGSTYSIPAKAITPQGANAGSGSGIGEQIVARESSGSGRREQAQPVPYKNLTRVEADSKNESEIVSSTHIADAKTQTGAGSASGSAAIKANPIATVAESSSMQESGTESGSGPSKGLATPVRGPEQEQAEPTPTATDSANTAIATTATGKESSKKPTQASSESGFVKKMFRTIFRIGGKERAQPASPTVVESPSEQEQDSGSGSSSSVQKPEAEPVQATSSESAAIATTATGKKEPNKKPTQASSESGFVKKMFKTISRFSGKNKGNWNGEEKEKGSI